MGCSRSVPKAPEEEKESNKQVRMSANVIGHDSKDRLQTTRTDLAKYILKFPKIKKAYKHLLTAWCEVIDKKRPQGAAAVFDLSGPRDLVSKALSLSGIITTDANITNALENAVTSQRPNEDLITFRDIIIAVCWLMKLGDKGGLERSTDEVNCVKYDEIMEGLAIVRDMFRQIDDDDSGEITLDEFKAAFAGLGTDDIYDKRMKELDFNNDQEISYPEFSVGIAVWVGFVHEFE